ncbi:hypothetical protein [Methylomonas methanica]|uniref:hypothetical protein n=1 Tax=Methylomonas methanica TaxID=421 RepID=UPI002368BC49|nr:hypothetical protein [Methylomonas methanica]
MLLSKLKDSENRKRYAEWAIEYGWSRNVLNIQIETRLLEREGNAVTNFEANLPKPHSDLARETLKDPYLFDFLGIGQEASEREIEAAVEGQLVRRNLFHNRFGSKSLVVEPFMLQTAEKACT